MEGKPTNPPQQPLMKFEEMTPEGQGLIRMYSVIDRLLSKLVNMDANDATDFVAVRQWLTGQAQFIARRERAILDSKPKAAVEAPTPPSPELVLVEGDKKE